MSNHDEPISVDRAQYMAVVRLVREIYRSEFPTWERLLAVHDREERSALGSMFSTFSFLLWAEGFVDASVTLDKVEHNLQTRRYCTVRGRRRRAA